MASATMPELAVTPDVSVTVSTLTHQQLGAVKDLFEKLDKNKDGTLQMSEWASYMKTEYGFTDAEAQKAWTAWCQHSPSTTLARASTPVDCSTPHLRLHLLCLGIWTATGPSTPTNSKG